MAAEVRFGARRASPLWLFRFSAKVSDGVAVEWSGLDCGGASPPLLFF
jgi:hypothetical protein